MVSKWRLEDPNIGLEKTKKSSEQGAGCGFLVLQSLRQAGAGWHTETRLLAAACRLEPAAGACAQLSRMVADMAV